MLHVLRAGIADVLLIAVLLSAVGGCASGSSGTETAAVAGVPAPIAMPFRYTCSGPPGFDPSILDQEPVAEQEDHPSALALRDALAGGGSEMDFLPRSGYWLASRDRTSAQYIARAAGVADPPFVDVHLEMQGGRWTLSGWGQCHPVAVVGALSLATWTLDPTVPDPDSTATSITALVTERACTGGDPIGGRILPPAIDHGVDAVSVVFAVRPLEGDSFTCPGNPPTRVVVELREPLGDRRLLDAAFFPPTDPAIPPS